MTLQNQQLKILNLLRNIYDETKTEYVRLNLAGKVKEYEIPNPNRFAPLLINNGILARLGNNPAHLTYKWNLDEAPTINLVEKYFGGKEYTSDKMNIKPTQPTKPVNTDKNLHKEKDNIEGLILTTETDLTQIDSQLLVDELKRRGFKGSLQQSYTL